MFTMGNKTYVALVFMFSVVWCYQCGEKDLDGLFDSESNLCNTEHKWTINRASVNIDKRNALSDFLTPGVNLSCMASKSLSLSSFGVLEVKVYTRSITTEDYVTVNVHEEGSDTVVGQASLSGEEGRVYDGWHMLKVTLNGVGPRNGYFTLMGKTSSNSDILVTSVCYTPEQQPLSKDTDHDHEAPDVYALRTGSALTYPVQRNDQENEEDVVETKFWIFDTENFWTPLTISLAVVIPVIILALLGWACFALGKRKGAKQDPQIVYEDVDNLPKPYLVPRVKSVYTESFTGSNYGSRNNNIYSV